MQDRLRKLGVAACAASLALLLLAGSAAAEPVAPDRMITARSTNKPLISLYNAALRMTAPGAEVGPAREIPNMMGMTNPSLGPNAPALAADPALQLAPGTLLTEIASGFVGGDNNDNINIFGVPAFPPDTVGAVGPNHFVQMLNRVTTIFDKNGGVVMGPMPNNTFWMGMGGECEPNNQGDPIVLYDERADRWLISQFAFTSANSGPYAQCVAISQTGDPTGDYNRYEFSFAGFGFNDYPKHGITTDSITMTANLFEPLGGFNFNFLGTFVGVMDRVAMYAGQPAELRGTNIGVDQFGFLAGDLDGTGAAGNFYATAMTSGTTFDIWEVTVDWSGSGISVQQIATIPISAYDPDLCDAGGEACIPQPQGGPPLEAISDRLMHRLQIRDFGAYRTMVTGHTVDVGGGRAGIRWYELRESNGTWSLYQEGTFAPDDGENRWMPSVAMNGAGDIGIGYLLASANTFVSTAIAGQSAAFSGTGQLDGVEQICSAGTGVQLLTGRAGDYSATSIDPVTDSFWHTNEVVFDTGNFSWATFVCEFTVRNDAPTAVIAAPLCDELSCDFDGSASFDGDGTIESFAWDFGDGTTATGATASHTYASEGTYTVTLTVTDDDGATGTSTVEVTVTETPPPNQPPTAAIATPNCADLLCNFDGNGSSDSDGTIESFEWDFGDGATGSGSATSHEYSAPGTYTVTLTVTDDDGATGGATVDVTVTAANQPPTAAIAPPSCVDLLCDFDGNGSSDSDGTIESFAWDFGDGATGTGATTSHEYSAAGTYTVTLTVTDNDGATGSATVDVTVTAANQPPTAVIASPACTELACSFDGSGSSDGDGMIVTFAWDFGDGTSGTGATTSHVYPAAGTYTVILTVTDDDGATGSAAVDVTVTETPPPNQPPTAVLGPPSCQDLTCDFDGGDSTDSDGMIQSFVWSFGDGTMGTGPMPRHTYPAAGTYTVALTVTDDDGASDSATQTVTVTEPPTGSISLELTGFRFFFINVVDLRWSGATSKKVDVYRNGVRCARTKNDGFYRDINLLGRGPITYQICEAGSTTACSDVQQITL